MMSVKFYEHEAYLYDREAKRAEAARANGRLSASPAFWRRKAEATRRAAANARKRETNQPPFVKDLDL